MCVVVIYSIERESAGVSSIIGTVVMVVLVIIAAGIVSTIVVDSISSTTSDVSADVSFSTSDDDSIVVTWDSKHSASSVVVSNGVRQVELTDVGESVVFPVGLQQDEQKIVVLAKDGDRETLIDTYVFNRDITHGISVRSESCDVPSCVSTVSVSDTEYTTEGLLSYGLNMFVFDDESGEIRMIGTFDTHTAEREYTLYSDPDSSGSTATCGVSCHDDIRGSLQAEVVDTDSVTVLLVGGGKSGRMTDETTRLYRDAGGTFSGDNELEPNDVWILLTTFERTNTQDVEYRFVPIHEVFGERTTQSGNQGINGSFYTPR